MINMIRQTGRVLGAAILIAVPGSSAVHGSAALGAVRHGHYFTAALPAASVVPAMTLLREGQ